MKLCFLCQGMSGEARSDDILVLAESASDCLGAAQDVRLWDSSLPLQLGFQMKHFHGFSSLAGGGVTFSKVHLSTGGTEHWWWLCLYCEKNGPLYFGSF